MSAPSVLSTVHHKPRLRRTRDQIEVLRREIIAVLRNDQPQSVRHVFYRMTDPRLECAVEKSDRGYRHVQYQMSEMRKLGLLPYGWITDATRRGYLIDTFSGGADFIRRMAGYYRADAWRHTDHYVEVWAESRSIAAVIQEDCEDLGVSLYPSGGFASLTLSYEAAAAIARKVGGKNKSIEIIYIGDYDPAGVLIDADIEAKLRGHLKSDNPLTFQRLAINEGQFQQYDLPTKSRKTGDRRSKEVMATVEAEAMPAHMLRGLLREKVESFIPQYVLRAARVAEESERSGLLALASSLDQQGGLYGE
jgi:hypothetical protein